VLELKPSSEVGASEVILAISEEVVHAEVDGEDGKPSDSWKEFKGCRGGLDILTSVFLFGKHFLPSV
jgi:hypothetical protein